MRVRIQHKTRYCYPRPTYFGPHAIRLRPADHARAKLLDYNLSIAPQGEVRWQRDPWNNHVARLTYPVDAKPAEALELIVDASFEIRPVNPFDFFVDDRCRELPFTYPDGLAEELAPFLSNAKPGPRLAAFLAESPAKGYVTDHLVALNQRVASEVKYILRDEPGVQSSEETLTVARGSCRDSALLLVDALRAQGFAARFVSGYLVQLTDEGNIPDLARGVTRDVVDLHAWCEVFIPGAGWVGLDGTSGLLCNEGHIALATAVHPSIAAAVDGSASEAAERFEFEMNISRLGHEPRPRKPYTDEQWQALLRAGDQVDASLEASGLALTMGGEPTWTSREAPREKEWNTDALGPTKWQQGLRLSARLHERLFEGALVLHRFGKHYPGESLPRWALQQLWRADGVPAWRDRALMDLPWSPERAVAATEADAERFVRALAERLRVDPSCAIEGYEDPWIAVVREQNFPDDVDPLKANLDDAEERRTLARVLSRGLATPVGYALPLARSVDRGWISHRWSFRRGRLYLVPGDSPMGLRLPLDRLGGTPDESIEPVRDITLGTPALPRYDALGDPLGDALGDVLGDPRGSAATRAVEIAFQTPATEGPRAASAARRGALSARGGSLVRTALCVEPRDGVLHVFLPPLPGAEEFFALVRAIEQTASELHRPVRLEGYPPPPDPRVRSCMVTPDPGVLEVNLPVTTRFAEYATLMGRVADAANHAGLTPVRYQLDGREAGSGGGHHLTLGGPSTAQSPFLQRPELLAAVLRFLQHHPSMSYLFTGLFVGPTSQAPRIDEGRHEALHELDIALARAQSLAGERAPAPWLVDRIFRNLLVDVAGNTHRTEVSIDKLYDPASLHGRQGLLEFRAFEMPPHEQMACAQMLLVRAVVAAMAREPYTAPLVRWGTLLHDRFLLPHFLWSDFEDVLTTLSARGVSLDPAWYRPFLDLRFPVMGRLDLENVSLEVRPALEPWHVLGEEGAASGTVRYVDSSLERVQLRVTGLTEGRHRVLVNGFELPLRATGRGDERVAGVRFRAWQPPHCLHPEIGVHHPLRFDLIDTWAKRSLGACTYHVWHPEGRAFDDPPLTAFEAAARRAQRFTTLGHAVYPVEPLATRVDPEQPYTLDLRVYPADRRLPAAP